ncbi:hypothetical protein KKC62_01485 [Patescibacteria group bacterium]|nr:hypothetical protein [Patescibacteria group bacterium]MBU1952869.1 hypothetical protein [Patescibacteria group bacterium]
MAIQSMIFILGLLVLLPSTSLLVKLSKLLANKLRISPLITGITIVALGTSLPELAVSATAAISNDYGLAIGNIIGSNISNVLLVLPIGILIGKLRIGTTKTQRTITALAIISVVFFILYVFKINSFFSGILLIGLGILVTFLEYKWGVEGGSHEDAFRVRKQQNEGRNFTLISLLTLFLSLIGIMLGGILIVKSTESLSELSGYSTAILGLSLTAIATSLPELLTTIFSQNENEEKLTLGNIIGSNIYNLTIIGGISAFFSQAVDLFVTDWIWFAFATLTIFSIVKIFKNITVPKSVGVILLLLMGLYLYSLTLVRV